MSSAAQTAMIEGGDPLVEQRAFRSCLGQFATGVTVVTAACEIGMAGVTANSFSSVSLDPPLVLWSIKRSSRSFAVFEKATHFAVNVLSNDQIELSQHFSRPSDDRFSTVTWKAGIHGSPLLDGVIATFECKRQAQFDGGDHVILVGCVERFASGSGSPLVFAQGRYAVAQEHPKLKSAPATAALQGPQGNDFPDIVTALFWANHLSSRAFEKHRQAEGLTFVGSRILYALYSGPAVALDVLEQRTDIPNDVIRDTLAELCERGLVKRVSARTFEITALGRQKRDAVVNRTAAFSAESLKWVPEETLGTVRSFLQEYARRLAVDNNDASYLG